MANAVLARKSLPFAVQFQGKPCCPSRDLLIFGPPLPSEEQPSPPCKIGLWRVCDPVDLVWEWAPKPPPPNLAAGPAALLRARQPQSRDEIAGFAWNPSGSHLAVCFVRDSKSIVTLLTINNNQQIFPDIPVPTKGTIIQVAWEPLSVKVESNYSPTRSLLRKLPKLNPLNKKKPSANSTTTTGVQMNMLQAKNAMLQREREKGATRSLDIGVASPFFPTLLVDPETEYIPESEETRKLTMLILTDDQGFLHLFLDGTTYVASVPSGFADPPVHVSICTPRNELLVVGSINESFESHSLDLFIPDTFQLYLEQCTMIRNWIYYAFEALQQVKALWDESRRLSRVLLQRISDACGLHDDKRQPVDQLLMLLFSGRPSKGLHDFLVSKMTEGVLTKMTSVTAEALQRLQVVSFTCIVPGLERVVLLLDELKAWTRVEKFNAFGLDEGIISAAIESCTRTIHCASIMESQVTDQILGFKSFSSWVTYEQEKLAQQEGSDIRPLANFDSESVFIYINESLGCNNLDKFMDFGLKNTPIAQNSLLSQASDWFNELVEHVHLSQVPKESTDFFDIAELQDSIKTLAKRMQDPGCAIKSVTDDGGPVSLPVLLHVMASRLGDHLLKGVECIGRKSQPNPVPIRIPADPLHPNFIKTWAFDNNPQYISVTSWIKDSTLFLQRRSNNNIFDYSAYALRDSLNCTFRVLDYDFFNQSTLILLVGINEKYGDGFYILNVSMAHLEFVDSLGDRNIAELPALPTTTALKIGSTTSPPPEQLTMNGRKGRFAVCILSNKGRQLDVYDPEAFE